MTAEVERVAERADAARVRLADAIATVEAETDRKLAALVEIADIGTRFTPPERSQP
jgi:hypothetical protein